jgi:ribosomal protein S6
LNRYEALFVLNTAGKEENAPEQIEAVKKELEAAGAVIKAVQKMDRKVLTRPVGKVTAGYYVNFVLEADSTMVNAVRPKLALNEAIIRFRFLRADEPKAAKKEAAAA